MSLLHTWVTQNRHLLTPEIYARWEAMQDHHIPHREAQMEAIKKIVGTTSWRLNEDRLRALDLGCGPGSLTGRLLRFGKQVWAVGMDADPMLLALAKSMHTDVADRVVWVEADFRTTRLAMSEPFQAIVSATALHWLGPDALRSLYHRCAEALVTGGVLAIADPLAGESTWRQGMIGYDDRLWKETYPHPGETWAQFYENLANEWPGFGEAMEDFRQRAGLWQGDDNGLPWSFHQAALVEAGFGEPEIYFRHGRQAVFGAVKR